MPSLHRSPVPKRLALAVAALLATSGAQAANLRYLFAGNEYPSLGAAEAALRAANPNWDPALSLCQVGRGYKETSLTYCTSQQPGIFWTNYYRTPSYTSVPCDVDDPGLGNYCSTEEALIQGIISKVVDGTTTCLVSTAVTGNNLSTPWTWGQSPYTVGSSVQFRYASGNMFDTSSPRTLVLETRRCGTTGSTKSYHQLRWSVFLKCPAGFLPATGPSTSEWPRVCNGGSVNLYKRSIENVTSCPHTDHPCAPATGEKLLTEVDFTWRGHTFTRMYASGHETPAQAGLGATWSHVWSLRLIPPASIAPQSLGELRTARNDVVQFQYLSGSTTVMAGVGARDQVLERQGDGSWLLTTSAGDTIRFDSTGVLQSMGPAGDPSAQLTFDVAGGRVLQAKDATGRALTFLYDGDALTGIRDDAGVMLASYTYDPAGRLAAVMFPDGKTRHYAYAEADHLCVGASSSCSSSFFPAHLTGVTDEAGRRVLDASYDESGRVVASVQPGASATTLAYGTLDQTEVTQSGEGRVAWTFTTDQMRRPLGRKVYEGTTLVSSEKWVYASDGSYTLYTNPDGVVTRSTYDARGLELTRVEAESKNGNTSLPEKRTTVTAWTAGTLPRPASVTVQDAAGQAVRRTDLTYNGRGQVSTATVTDPRTARSRVENRVYCEAGDIGANGCAVVGQLMGVEAPGGGITSYSYRVADAAGCAPTSCDYRAGDLYQVTDAAGHTQSIDRYDAAGRPVALTDANGVATTLTYDPRGRLVTTNVGGRATGFGYDAGGFLASVTDADGVVLHTTHDALGRLTDVRDGLGNTIHYTLDAAGGRVKEEVRDSSGTLSRSLSRVFDSLAHVRELRDALGRTVQSYGYDASGRVVSSVDGRGVAHSWGYDALGRLLSKVDDVGGTDAGTANATTSMAYDALDQLIGVSDPSGLPTIYDRDGLGNLTGQHSPDTAESAFTYDDAGNPLTSTDARGITVTRTFDAPGRVMTESYPTSAENAVYHYDEPDAITGCAASFPIGRLTRAIEASGVSTVYCYDAHGQVTHKTQTVAGTLQSIAYGYSAAGRLTSLTYPSGARVAYTHDAAGQVASATLYPAGGGNAQPIATDVHYAPFGPVASYTLGNGQTVARSFDANGEISAVSSAALDLQFTRDVLGNITALSGADSETYSYDALQRLTGVRDGAGAVVEAYTYNKTGDRLSKAGAGQATGVYSYAPGTHHLMATGAYPRAYDAAGNTTGTVVAGEAFGFAYNDRNRLGLVQRSGATVGTYAYNVLGERVGKEAGGVATQFAYDEASQMVGEAGAGAFRDYVRLGDLPVAVVDSAVGTAPAEVHYVHAGALGSPRVVTDQAAAPVWRWDYKANPFGERDATGTFDLRLRFPGQFADAENRLNQNIRRDYDPATGRYGTPDPLGLQAGASLYGYVGGAPLDYYDPYGLWAWGDPLPQWLVDASVGFGDGVYSGITFGFGDLNDVRDALNIAQAHDPCSKLYRYSRIAGGIEGGMAVGGAIGLAGRARSGYEFSHALPARWIKTYGLPKSVINSRMNGTYVPWWFHAMTDPYRFRFVPRSVKPSIPQLPIGISQIMRTPPWAVGGAAGLRNSSGSCSCEG